MLRLQTECLFCVLEYLLHRWVKNYIKSTNLLANVLASKTAHEKGCEEAIFIRDGIVTEGAKSSLLIISEDKIKTHPLTHDILPGITRNHILNIAAKMGLRVIEAPFKANELFQADEVMITSTTKLARRVESIDGIGVGGRQSGLVRSIQSTMYDDILRST